MSSLGLGGFDTPSLQGDPDEQRAQELQLALGTPDEVAHHRTPLESPLVSYLLHADAGVVEGREELRRFVERVFDHQPPQRGRSRTGYLSEGTRLTWEYPRATSDGEQMDIVEVMDIDDGLIQHHRVYWGWYSVGMLRRGEHPK